jgi:hypothetical protein
MRPVPSILLFGLLAVAAAAAPLMRRSGDAGEAERGQPWPERFEGRPLAALPPAPEDAILARNFPGRVARFSDGRRQIVLRRLAAATRRLHPASDCFRATGYEISPAPMRVAPGRGPASCFTARRDGLAYLACEQVSDQAGRSWPDVSSWYWAALLGTSRGPWLATLTVERIAPRR